MTGHKYDVTFYLEEDEAEAFEKYREEKGCCLVRGGMAVIREFLVEKTKKDKGG
jgi:hypothetical protein